MLYPLEDSFAPVCAFRRHGDGFCLLHRSACACTGNCAACSARVKPVDAHMKHLADEWFKRLQDVSTKEKRFQLRTRGADHYNIYRTCTCKRRFPTQERAMEKARDTFRRLGLMLSVYACPFCGGYHLTKQNRPYLPHVHSRADRLFPTEGVA